MGSGKPLINLIPRFYDPQQGRITIDGIDLRNVTLPSLRQRSVLFLETYLFSEYATISHLVADASQSE